MPIEDDGPCFFCGKTLWNLDGMLACEEGCGAYEILPEEPGGEIWWCVPQSQVFKTFHVNEEKAA